MELTDKVALVTGGASGIGLGVALALAREGCRVVIADRNRQRLEEAAKEFAGKPLVAWPCDVADRQDVDRLVARVEHEIGPPDILVSAAGINVVRREMDVLDPADWDRILAVNATGVFNCVRAVLPAMRRRKAGLIVNISSISGKRAFKVAGTAYCASKFAVTALGAAARLEERRNGIHITTIYPGEVNTPLVDQRPVPVSPEIRAQMLQPEDIGACVVAIARLPARAVVPELVITPLYQEYI